jgi:peptidoglycan hydrolase FlgJ
MDIRTPVLPAAASDVYTDLNSLNNIKNEANSDEALKKVAQQFESLFVHELLKNMRSANQVFEEGSLFNSSESNFFRDMYDQQLSLSMSKKGIGIADTLYAQMRGQFGGDASTDVMPEGEELWAQVQQRRTSLNPYFEPKIAAHTDKSLVLNTHPSTQKNLVEAVTPVFKTQSNWKTALTSEPFGPSARQRECAVEPLFGKGKKDGVFNDAAEFVDAILPKAKKAAETLGINPLVLVAQSALETGWGKFVVGNEQGKTSHNLFNIKADTRWNGQKVGVSTVEFYNGSPIREQASFRAYDSFDESFDDFVDFLQSNPRYQSALSAAGDEEKFVQHLHKAGYATDPNYSNKVMSVYKQLVSGGVNRLGETE